MPMMMGEAGGWAFLLWGVPGIVGLVWLVWRYGLAHPRRDNRPLTASDPLVIARERYAQGLITKEEFEDVVHHLLNTERADP